MLLLRQLPALLLSWSVALLLSLALRFSAQFHPGLLPIQTPIVVLLVLGPAFVMGIWLLWSNQS